MIQIKKGARGNKIFIIKILIYQQQILLKKNYDVDYDESIERVESVIQANLDYIHKRIPAIVEGPYYKGVEKLGASGVTIKIVAKVKEEDKYQVQRDMNREIKIIFDKNNVSIPFDQIVVSDRTPIAEFKAKNMDDFVDEQRELSKDFEDIE